MPTLRLNVMLILEAPVRVKSHANLNDVSASVSDGLHALEAD